MDQVRAKKSLGQHFLKDQNIAVKIVNSLDTPPSGQVLEIGPGTGVLTAYLIENTKFRTTVIEIDRESVAYLNKRYPSLDIIEADFLRVDLGKYFSTPFSIIGNFPYNISSQIFFRILDLRQQIPSVVCMIQKEVAERIAAPPGNKTYGILSVLLQAYYDIDYLFTVSQSVFSPPPKVKSAVIRLTRNQTEKLDCNEKLFFKVVKTAFNQRRKTLRNALKGLFPGTIPQAEILSLRAERLSVEQFVELTKLISEKQ
ncbi:MAG TPA: 16S rRNA (adenine(1518)-N(6)/adenine(1519)-N(6))-dimethyltransferase RsmA [Bacteroidales bacterium]|nr:16S rRNA (adenine(1518)-N(6)/adenine(1519)-N(6))-dimethyltransferase RsmA [Bacteroidales bacterium]